MVKLFRQAAPADQIDEVAHLDFQLEQNAAIGVKLEAGACLAAHRSLGHAAGDVAYPFNLSGQGVEGQHRGGGDVFVQIKGAGLVFFVGAKPPLELLDKKPCERPDQANPQDVYRSVEQGQQDGGIGGEMENIRKDQQGMEEKGQQEQGHTAGDQVEDDMGRGHPFGIGGGAQRRQGGGGGGADVGANDHGGAGVQGDKPPRPRR